MSKKNSVQVLINGKVTTLTGYESEEYLERVASYLNKKQQEIKTAANWRRMTDYMKGTMLALNIADDLYKARERAEGLEDELKSKDRELYDLKQELVDLQLELESLKKKR